MKSPEEYLKNLVNNYKGKNEPYLDSSYFIYDGTVHPIINIIKQAQIDAYNEALDDAVENATIEHIDLTSDEVFDYTDVLVDDDVEVRINKQSILKLKK